MYKVLVILLLIWLLLIPTKQTKTVFSEINNDYNTFEVYFDKSINVKELNNYNFQILTIYPYINPLYINKVSNLTSYSFHDKLDTDKFTNYYIDQLEKKGYKQEAIKAKINGVYVSKMRVYTTEDNLRQYNLHFRQIS